MRLRNKISPQDQALNSSLDGITRQLVNVAKVPVGTAPISYVTPRTSRVAVAFRPVPHAPTNPRPLVLIWSPVIVSLSRNGPPSQAGTFPLRWPDLYQVSRKGGQT
jgi:hypothetical protein